ncbi:hypothetical protein GQ43DRAFT_472550 [Delitschia confertaspora ATCC 74209]|uniref:CRIB domain-containing protein n=1 Tax=Delitschia confertaspora ATCC 74209 TaxID=1513339 RepID=A0A9P4MY70_9PLEO|nr:hypothetical protein GQ43DRAFT_472550 [Delitschia confertaspora ATCC 74209]
MTGTDGSSDLRHMSNSQASFLELTGSKRSFFTRGRKSRRQSSQLSSSVGDENEADIRRASILRKDRSRRGAHMPQASGNYMESFCTHTPTPPLTRVIVPDLKGLISSPFDFQHVTHTNSNQFTALGRSSGNEIAAEFWAVRASQVPHRGLNGIKAEDLQFQEFSSDDFNSPGSRSASALDTRSPPLSPSGARQEEQRPGSSHSQSGKSLRLSRSVESFSQPVIKNRTHRHTQSAAAPPRISSRLPLTRIEDLPEDLSPNPRSHTFTPSPSNRNSGIWDIFAPSSPPTTGERLTPIADEEPTFVGHAVTTPDDSAIHIPFSPSLENVSEEPEPFSNPRPAPPPPARSSKISRSPSTDLYSFRDSTSLISRSNGRQSPLTSPKSATQRTSITRPMSQMSDTLNSAAVTRQSSIRRPIPARHNSGTWRAYDESWEEDIDYIYEHALEADCEWDWEESSTGNGSDDRELTPGREEPMKVEEHSPTAISQIACTASKVSAEEPALQTRFFPGAFRPSLLVPVPSPNAVPELESRSAVSTSTADTGIRTPLDYYTQKTTMLTVPAPYAEGEGFSLSPSLLVPHDYKEQSMREEMYEDLLAEYESSDRHFPLLDASQSVASSSRSSRVRSSKRSSYDSSLASKEGSGSVSWNSPVRRSASSSGSLPELVHSRRARKTFDMMVDHLSEQVASFASFGEDEQGINNKEDDDTTPPGNQINAGRTFFASDDEDHPEEEATTSVEISPQQASASAHSYHKHATSEGAVQILTTSSEEPQQLRPLGNRKRAASSAATASLNRNRPAQLSLFPAPSRYKMQSPAPPSAR